MPGFPPIPVTRRSMLKGGGGLLAASFVGALDTLYARRALAAQGGGASSLVAGPYGPVAPVADLTTGLPILRLPEGFSYRTFAWAGDPMIPGVDASGSPLPAGVIPNNHDGMAVVRQRRVGRSTELTLIVNHERAFSASSANIIAAGAVYDSGSTTPVGGTAASFMAGGTTNVVLRDGLFVSCQPSLGGTYRNCAGGPTPWGTWLTAEEYVTGLGSATGIGANSVSSTGKRHGYVFEVRADAGQTTAVPIVGMGRFSHEAAAVDPVSGFVYLTEDDSNKSGLYRFIPNDTRPVPGALEAGGRLQGAKIKGVMNADLTQNVERGDTYEIEWVDIADPDLDRGGLLGSSPLLPTIGASTAISGPFRQAWRDGAFVMRRGEGIWFSNGKMYIVDTSASATLGPGSLGSVRSEGCVWELDCATQIMRCIYVSPIGYVGNNPDNVTVSPRGGVVLCEDGGSIGSTATGNPLGRTIGARCLGLTPGGDSFVLVENNFNFTTAQLNAVGKNPPSGTGNQVGAEFAGACWDPTGRVLFVNIYTPGLVCAITGPWARGNL